MSFCMIVPPSPYLYNPWTIEPLGALYVAGAAKEVVGEVYVRVWGEEEIPDAKWYGVSVVTPHFSHAKRIIQQLRKDHSLSKIVAGGAHCTFLPASSSIDLSAHYVIAGEGELSIQALLSGKLLGVPGVYTGAGFGGGLSEPPDFASLPIPDHSLLLHDYYPNPAFSDEPGGAITASRGCPFGCSYCGKSVGRRQRWRDPLQVAEEMEVYSQWRFEDDDIFGNWDWFEALCAAVPADKSWRCSARATSITPEILQMAKRAGCKQVGIGVETANARLLKLHCPSKSVERNTEAVRMVKAAGLKVTAFLIAGLPGETEETLQDTIDWIEKEQPDKFTVSACTPYPGTPIYDNPERYGVTEISQDFDDFMQLGREDESEAFVFDTEQLDRAELTELWKKLRGVAQYGIAEKK